MSTGIPTTPLLTPAALPHPARATLPTMYDLPSEDPEEPGVPDEFHLYQPQLLRETFQPPAYQPDGFFVAADLNLYYDVQQPGWYKRPDWYAVLGVSRLYAGHDMRLSYVIWQEQVVPYLIVELLSPGTEHEDLGRTQYAPGQPPTKWLVYEQILGVPHYVVFSRYSNELRYFRRVQGRYREVRLAAPRLWLPEAELGLGLWSGAYEGIERPWLRCYDAQGVWLPTLHEQAEQERQRAEQERQRAEQERQRAEQERQRAEQERQRSDRLAAQLKALGIEPQA